MSDYDFYKSMMNNIRTLNENGVPKGRLLTEDDDRDKASKAIAITNDIKFGDNVLQKQIDAFRSTVNPGAKFSKEDSENATSNPLVFFPKDGNLVFSGSIPTLSGMKFQFSLNDVTESPYVFVDGLALTANVLDTLKKLKGFYDNWKEEWLTAGDLLDKLKKENK